MMTDARAAAVRISRPYETDDELLEHDAKAFSRNGIVLVGAPEQALGTVVRFEVLLSTGAPALRGEGRVVGMKEVNGTNGLSLRFTRLDSKTKALVDRASAMRQANESESRRSLPPPAMSEPQIVDLPSRPEVNLGETGEVHAAAMPFSFTPPSPSAPPPPPQENDEDTREEAVREARRPIDPPRGSGDRNELLQRLRDRQKRLSPDYIAQILAKSRENEDR